jgi:hypothetical protein
VKEAVMTELTLLPAELTTMTPAQLATLAPMRLASLGDDLDQLQAQLKLAKSKLEAALDVRYAAAARKQLLTDGRDTGTTHILDGDCDATVEIAKDVKYDAAGLTELVAKISAAGGDVREYVEIKYSVSERKYQAWPQMLREPFERIRTVTPKAPKVTLRPVAAKEVL